MGKAQTTNYSCKRSIKLSHSQRQGKEKISYILSGDVYCVMRYISYEVFRLHCVWYDNSVLSKLNKNCEVHDRCFLYEVPQYNRTCCSGIPLYDHKLHILVVWCRYGI
jgi:hypothetical protein